MLLLSPYVPLLFMGEEHAEANPFLYFVSHGDPALVEAVREGRRREFESFAWAGEIPILRRWRHSRLPGPGGSARSRAAVRGLGRCTAICFASAGRSLRCVPVARARGCEGGANG